MKTVRKLSKPIQLLVDLIQKPSFSGEEDRTADILSKNFTQNGVKHMRDNHNVWAFNKEFDNKKKTILLNSHHDTVKPNQAYTKDPFNPGIDGDKLYGLGSNDAGGSLVALIEVFCHFYKMKRLKYNLVIAATAEEENSGHKGIRSVISQLPEIDFAIVGEPTEMQMAIAEKGLLVLDAHAKGISGHAAHENTKNPIYDAMKDIDWFQNYQFPKHSEQLGKVKMSVTQINSGSQHNVVPSECHFVIDIRVNEHYTNQEVLEVVESNTSSSIKARSTRLNSSGIDKEHPIVEAGLEIGLTSYGSPTMSDQANLTCPSLKIGPGKSSRSHSADEYICLSEIEKGIEIYKELLNKIIL